MLTVQLVHGFGNMILQMYLGLYIATKIKCDVNFYKTEAAMNNHILTEKNNLPHPLNFKEIFPNISFIDDKPDIPEIKVPRINNSTVSYILNYLNENENMCIILCDYIVEEIIPSVKNLFEPSDLINEYLNKNYPTPYNAIHIRLPQQADFFPVREVNIKNIKNIIRTYNLTGKIYIVCGINDFNKKCLPDINDVCNIPGVELVLQDEPMYIHGLVLRRADTMVSFTNNSTFSYSMNVVSPYIKNYIHVS